MTYNIGHYDYGTGVGIPSVSYAEKLANYKSFFSEHGCHFLGLQEWAEYLDANQSQNSNNVLFNTYFPYNGGNTNLWCALKGKQLMYGLETGSLGNRPYVGAKTILNGKQVQLYSVHLSPGASNTSARITEAQQLIAKVANIPRYIILGDFNPEPGEEDSLYKLFTDEGMHIANCGDFGKIITYHNDNQYIIDNIITSQNIDIVNAFSLDVYSQLSSDHLPLVADLKVH